MKFISLIFIFTAIVLNSYENDTIKVALSFDDAPKGKGVLFSCDEKTDRLINTLDKYHIQSVFYVNPGKFDNNNGLNRIKKYDSAGHFIANHTVSHPMLSKVSAEDYINEIIECDKAISGFTNNKKWFRYTYLDQCNDRNKRDSVWHFLDDFGYQIGYCTVDNYDWYIDALFKNNYHEDIDLDKVKEFYLEHIFNSIKFYNDMALETLGYSPYHVLLLHENDINALFLEDLIKLFKNNNIEIISPELAYTDKIASIRPDVTQNYQGRVAAISFSKGYKGKIYQESEDTDYLDSLFKDKIQINF